MKNETRLESGWKVSTFYLLLKVSGRRLTELAFSLRRRGLTIPTTDLMIAAVAIENKSVLLHHDKHHERIVSYYPTPPHEIFWPLMLSRFWLPIRNIHDSRRGATCMRHKKRERITGRDGKMPIGSKHKTGRAGKGLVREPAAAYGGPGGEVVLYRAPDGMITLDVRLEQETVWLSLNQMAALFERDKSVISRHLRNVFKEDELDRQATVANFATVQIEGERTVTRQVEYYNLNAVISVGYRVNSKRGTQFRIWATRVLHDHIVKGYSINQKRLRDLNRAVRLIADTAKRRDLSGDEAKALLRVVGEYSQHLDLLDDYDHQRVRPLHPTGKVVQHAELRGSLSDRLPIEETLWWVYPLRR